PPPPGRSAEETPAAGEASAEQVSSAAPASALPDYYAALGVAPGADRQTVAAAYDRLAREYQPDINAPATNPQRITEIDEAFDVLDDPRRRAAYDRRRRGVVRSSAAETAATRLMGRARSDRTLLAAPGPTPLGILALVAARAVLLLHPLRGGGPAPRPH